MIHTIWNEKYRPSVLENFISNEGFKSKMGGYIKSNDIPHLIFAGQVGSGKTTIAKILAKNIDCDYIYINASDENGIDTIRDKVKSFASTASFKTLKLVVLDECLEENTLVVVLREGRIQKTPIRDLDYKNDLVKSYNIEFNRVEWKPFYLWDKGEQEVYEIEFENIFC